MKLHLLFYSKKCTSIKFNKDKDFENDFIMSVVIDFLKNDNEKHLNIYGNYDCNESRKLANKRAKSCFEYFVKSGIDKKRLHIVPFDKNEIKFDRKTCDSNEIDESMNQGMRRVDFEIVYENQKDSVIEASINTESNLESVQLEKPIQIELHVFDKETKNPIPNAKVTFTKSDDSEVISNTDNLGKVIFENVISNDTSLSHRKFSYAVSKNGFIVVQDDKILSKGKNKISDTIYMLNVVDKVLDLPQIWFAYDKKDLLVQEGRINSYDSLDYLYQILIDNPSLVVEIQVHSDCRGSNKYSRRLSPARAQSCLEYLVSKGIPKERLIASGYGDEVPRKPGLDCESINKMPTKEEQEKAHQQNRRVQYKVLSFDYKPKVDFDINDVPKVEYEFD